MKTAALAIVLLGCLMTKSASAIQCYVCDSSASPQCSENVFISLLTHVEDGCSCCRKSVSDGATKRECMTGLASLVCVPLPNNHICLSDKCNNANTPRVATISIVVSVMTTVAMAATAGFRE